MIANELNYIIKPQQEHHRQAQTVEMYRTAGEGKEGIVELSSLPKLCSSVQPIFVCWRLPAH